MLRFHGYILKSAYEEGEEEEPMALLDSAAARLVTKAWQTIKFLRILYIAPQFFNPYWRRISPSATMCKVAIET